MIDNGNRKKILVGIDGSEAAIGAALWAVDEAVDRALVMHLVYAISAAAVESQDYEDQVRQAKAELQAACAAVTATGRGVQVQTRIGTGPPAQVLIDESGDADMLCVGSVGIGRYAREVCGSTATAVAAKAQCPVAVIRPTTHAGPDDIAWIVTASTREPGRAVVVERAMQEARLRGAPVLLLGEPGRKLAGEGDLDREVALWRNRFPGVHVYPIEKSADVPRFLYTHDEPVTLAVVGGFETEQLVKILGPYRRQASRRGSSVLVAR